jgi:hypothetical protein
MSRSRFKNAQNAEPSVNSDRRATFPDCLSYVVSAGSTSDTSVKNCASSATDALGAFRGLDDVEDVVGTDAVVMDFGAAVVSSLLLNIQEPAPTATSKRATVPTMNRRERCRVVMVSASSDWRIASLSPDRFSLQRDN